MEDFKRCEIKRVCLVELNYCVVYTGIDSILQGLKNISELLRMAGASKNLVPLLTQIMRSFGEAGGLDKALHGCKV